MLRKLQHALTLKLDGTPASERTVTRKRATLNNVVEYAIEVGLLYTNPLPKLRQRSFGTDRQVDPRVVVSGEQGRRLLAAVADNTPHLTAYFALLLCAGMRPAEARSIRRDDLQLPADGWGRATLSRTEQRPGTAWTDSESATEQRGLKHRPRSAVRMVPLRPGLVEILKTHLADFPCGFNGELFVSRTGRAGVPLSPPYHSLVSDKSIYRAWANAREHALTPTQSLTELGRRPYDLRHACLTAWLNAGVPPAQVAVWAGHSTRVLLDVYAGCIDGGEDAAMALIDSLSDS
ncbi:MULTISPECIES: tyrosine-type recombinase/integrase [unclassified Nocardioides]|uniref:tyrosine-type recombinase/integrase n=1 Tax=unclassified Nocardioides TaxID=2615069 RepID=UPI0030146979